MPYVDNGRARSMNEADDEPRPIAFTAAEVGALAHLYRGEPYRSTVWRTRLDATTNWAVATQELLLDLHHPGRRLRWQASDPSRPRPVVRSAAGCLTLHARRPDPSGPMRG